MRTDKLGLAVAVAVGCVMGLAQRAAAQDYTELTALAADGGGLELFAVRRDAEIERRYQLQSGGDFSRFEVLGGQGQDIAALQLADQSLDVIIVGMDAALWENRREGDGGWSGWVRLGGEASRVAEVRTAAGTTVLLSIRPDAHLELRQRVANSGDWSAPRVLNFQAKRLAAVADTAAESLSLFAIGTDDAVWRAELALADGSEERWQDLGGLMHDIAAARAPDGSVSVVVAGDDGAVWSHVEQDGQHVGWRRDGGEGAQRVELAPSGGVLEVLALNAQGGVSVARPNAEGVWSDYQPLDVTQPEAEPLASTFRGRVRVEIPSLNVSVERDLSFDVRFSGSRSALEITKFDPIVTQPFDTPFGSNVSTVTWVGGGQGSFDANSGRVDLPVALHFDQSLRIPLVNTDVDASLPLSTAADGGAPLDPETGQLALVATSSFTGSGANPLSGAAVRVVLTGAFEPRP